MNHHKALHALFGLKWNPFTPDIPVEGLWMSPRVENFCRRVETIIEDGGFVLVTGDPGNGKSAALRLIADRFREIPEIHVGVLSRPQSNLADFYRELGDIFAVELRPHNRWRGFETLRERWRAHAQSSLLCPVLFVDEAQQMSVAVLSELRLLAMGQFDTETYITVILGGDARLVSRFREPELLPLGSRIRTRLVLDYTRPEELREALEHVLEAAGNPSLLTDELKATLVERAAGNFRVLMNVAAELLVEATLRRLPEIDQKLFFEVWNERNGQAPDPRRRRGSKKA